MGPIRVLIASDHALFREVLCLFLAQQEDMQLVGEAPDGLQALRMDVLQSCLGTRLHR